MMLLQPKVKKVQNLAAVAAKKLTSGPSSGVTADVAGKRKADDAEEPAMKKKKKIKDASIQA
jgi:hypothetical protein